MEREEKSYNRKTAFFFAPSMKYVTITARRLAPCNPWKYLKAVIYKEQRKSKHGCGGYSPIHPSLLLERTSQHDFPGGSGTRLESSLASSVHTYRAGSPAPIPPELSKIKRDWKSTPGDPHQHRWPRVSWRPQSHSTMLPVSTRLRGGSHVFSPPHT